MSIKVERLQCLLKVKYFYLTWVTIGIISKLGKTESFCFNPLHFLAWPMGKIYCKTESFHIFPFPLSALNCHCEAVYHGSSFIQLVELPERMKGSG